MRLTRRLLLAPVLALVILCVPVTTHASTRATLSLSPKKVLDGSRVSVKAAGLHAKSYYTFLLVGPKAKKDRALLGLAQADSKGRISTVFKLPVILHCGKSTVYVFDTKHILAHASLAVTGCTIKGGPGAPPPAPKKG